MSAYLSTYPLLFALAACAACRSGDTTAVVQVAAAANTAKAFGEIGAAFTAKTGTRVDFSFQASGMLEKQLEAGAPFDVFASANKQFADQAVASGKCEAASEVPFARGRLVAWVLAGAPTALGDLADASRYRRIAIANPETAPYGRAAQQALQRAGVWAGLQDRLVIGDNIEATLQFAATGNADVALVAESLAIGAGGTAQPVDPRLYDPIDQYAAACGTGPGLARGKAFLAFLASQDGRAILARFGFSQSPTQ